MIKAGKLDLKDIMIWKNKKDFIILLILIFLFPPLPRTMFSFVFKMEFFVLVSLSLILLVYFIKNKKVLQFPSFPFILTWLGWIGWGILIGIINKNSAYILIKDLIYMLIPFIVIFLLKNFNNFLDNNFLEVLFRYGLIVSLVQIVLEYSGIISNIQRHVFRHIFLLLSTELIPLILILWIIYKRKLFDYRVFIYILTLLLTKGRIDLLFILLILFSYLFILMIKSYKYRAIYLFSLFFMFSFLWILPLLFPPLQNFFDSSIKWRYLEWQSFFEFKIHLTEVNIFSGQGFGATLLSIRPLKIFLGQMCFYLDRFHNIFLFLIFKLGVIGLIFYYYLFFYTFKNIKSLKKNSTFMLKFFLIFLMFIVFPVHGGFTMSFSQGIIFGFVLYLVDNEEFIFYLE